MKKTNVAILIAHRKLRHWQLAALEEASDVLHVKAVINCTNPSEHPVSVRNLGVLLLRRHGDRCPEAAEIPVAVDAWDVHDVEFEQLGESQILPDDVLQWLAGNDVELAINFGIDRLRCDDKQNNLPILMFTDENPGGNTLGLYDVLNYEGKSCSGGANCVAKRPSGRSICSCVQQGLPSLIPEDGSQYLFAFTIPVAKGHSQLPARNTVRAPQNVFEAVATAEPCHHRAMRPDSGAQTSANALRCLR